MLHGSAERCSRRTNFGRSNWSIFSTQMIFIHSMVGTWSVKDGALLSGTLCEHAAGSCEVHRQESNRGQRRWFSTEHMVQQRCASGRSLFESSTVQSAASAHKRQEITSIFAVSCSMLSCPGFYCLLSSLLLFVYTISVVLCH